MKKYSRGKTFMVCQQYSLCRENLFSLPTIAYFSVLIKSRKMFSGKTFMVSETP